jgi:hypothetical protein
MITGDKKTDVRNSRGTVWKAVGILKADGRLFSIEGGRTRLAKLPCRR